MGAIRFKVVIPTRYDARRLPGKPLREIGGKPLIRHVYERATESAAEAVVVATDDARIAAACAAFGADVALTRSDHRSGTDRIAEVAARRQWPPDAILVNLQGDEPCMPPSLIDQVASDLADHADAAVATPAHPIADLRLVFDPNLVKVVTDERGYALYFSRAPVPWHRDRFPTTAGLPPPGSEWLRHIGLYAYRAAFLARFVTWGPAPLEHAESLEQLRVLWHGEKIHVTRAAEEPGPGVDTPADLEAVAALLGASRE